MKDSDWHPPDVPSITFEKVAFHPDNPAKEPHPRIKDGWLEVIIKNDGKNPFYPSEDVYAFTFIRTTARSRLGFNGTNGVKYIVIEEDEELLEGFIEEAPQEVPQHGTIFGLWFHFVIRTPLGKERHVRSLIRAMQKMAPA